MAESKQDQTTIIGADAVFKGELSFDSTAKILGTVEGSITSKGTVQIVDGATCKADLEAKEITVEGTVEGTCNATDRVDVKSTGVVKGDIIAARMSMAEGASVDGHIVIGSKAGKGGTTAEVKPGQDSKAGQYAGQAKASGDSKAEKQPAASRS